MTTTNWNVSTDGNWTDPANWTNGVPTSSSDAIIAVPGVYTVVIRPTTGFDISVNSLTANNPNATLDFEASVTLTGTGSTIGSALVGGGSLSIDGDATLNSGASLRLSTLEIGIGGTLTVNETVSYGGRFTMLEGTLTVTGGSKLTLISHTGSLWFGSVNGSGSIATTQSTDIVGLTIGGAIAWNNIGTMEGGNLTLGDASGGSVVFSNLTAGNGAYVGVYNLDGNSDVSLGGGAGAGTYFFNAGLLEKTGQGGTGVFSVKVVDVGETEIDSGTLAFDGDGNGFSGYIGGAGVLSFGGGSSLINPGTAIATSALSIGGGATVRLNETLRYGGRFLQNSGTTLKVQPNGIMILTGVGDAIAGAIDGPGDLYFDGASAAINSGATITTANWDVINGAMVTLNEDVSYAGTFDEGSIPPGTVALNGHTLTLSGTSEIDGRVTGAGTLAFAGGTTTIAGSLDIGTLAFTGGSANLYGGTNIKTSNWVINGGAKVDLFGSLIYGGALTMGSDATLSLGYYKLTLSGSGSVLSGSITGSLLATTGNATIQHLTFSGVWHNAGTITAAGNLTNYSSVDFANLTSGTYDLTGDFNIIGQSHYFEGTFLNSGLLEKTGGSGTSTVSSTLFNNGTVTAASGVLDFTGRIYGNSTQSTLGGTFNITDGATLRFDNQVSSGQTVAFGSGGGVLGLSATESDETSDFQGGVSGFGTGDAIDLLKLAFSGSNTVTFTENAAHTQGRLLVLDASGSGASIILFGQYVAAGFHLASDGASGTAVTYTPPTPSEAGQLALAHH